MVNTVWGEYSSLCIYWFIYNSSSYLFVCFRFFVLFLSFFLSLLLFPSLFSSNPWNSSTCILSKVRHKFSTSTSYSLHQTYCSSTIWNKWHVTINNMCILRSFSDFPSSFKLIRRNVLFFIHCSLSKRRSCLYKQGFSFFKVCFVLGSFYYISVKYARRWFHASLD